MMFDAVACHTPMRPWNTTAKDDIECDCAAAHGFAEGLPRRTHRTRHLWGISIRAAAMAVRAVVVLMPRVRWAGSMAVAGFDGWGAWQWRCCSCPEFDGRGAWQWRCSCREFDGRGAYRRLLLVTRAVVEALCVRAEERHHERARGERRAREQHPGTGRHGEGVKRAGCGRGEA